MNSMYDSIQYSISYDSCQISLDTTMNELYEKKIMCNVSLMFILIHNTYAFAIDESRQ